jgi:hypothetical protein
MFVYLRRFCSVVFTAIALVGVIVLALLMLLMRKQPDEC